MTDLDTERAKFEAQCNEWGWDIHRGVQPNDYQNVTTDAAWVGWLARAEADGKTDEYVAHLVEEVAKVLSGAPFPSARSYAKAREVVDLLIAPPKEDGE